MKQALSLVVLIISGFVISGCAAKEIRTQEALSCSYMSQTSSGLGINTLEPAFIVNGGDSFNRIGMPVATQDDADAKAHVFVDENRPAMYLLEKTFKTSKATYKNYVYRVHFKGIPFFHLTYGKNTGIMVVVTTDMADNPLLITTVHTCGCYRSTIPTTHLDPSFLPDNWTGEPMDVFGETLPAILDFKGLENPQLVVNVRKDTHRVAGLSVVENVTFINENTHYLNLPVLGMESLETLDTGFGTTSFYYEKGWKKGFVKGSEKIWETLLMGIISCDFYVGTDKIYGEGSKTNTRFYTSLKFWNRDSSDMWDFATFLKFWGWKL